MVEIHTSTTNVHGLIKTITKLTKDGVEYTDEWLDSYINQWFMVD